jgi:hypothetical protein
LENKLTEIPKEAWKCPNCIKKRKRGRPTLKKNKKVKKEDSDSSMNSSSFVSFSPINTLPKTNPSIQPKMNIAPKQISDVKV